MLAPLGAAVALCATAAALAVVSLSARENAAELASLRTAGTWPNSAPSYEPHVGDVLNKQAVRDYHPRRPGGRGMAASAEAGEPLVTSKTEREVKLVPLEGISLRRACGCGMRAPNPSFSFSLLLSISLSSSLARSLSPPNHR